MCACAKACEGECSADGRGRCQAYTESVPPKAGIDTSHQPLLACMYSTKEHRASREVASQPIYRWWRISERTASASTIACMAQRRLHIGMKFGWHRHHWDPALEAASHADQHARGKPTIAPDGDDAIADSHDPCCMRRNRGSIAINPKLIDTRSPCRGFGPLLRRTNSLRLTQRHAGTRTACRCHIIACHDDLNAAPLFDYNQRE